MNPRAQSIIRWILLIGGIVLDLLGRFTATPLSQETKLAGDVMVGAGVAHVAWGGVRRLRKKR
jgi:hypothetical protein